MISFFYSLRPRRAVATAFASLCVALPPLAVAQTASVPGAPSGGASVTQPSFSLRAALDAAWALHPSARALGNRSAELDARARAAQSFTSGPAAFDVAHRSDALSGNAGLREYELGVEVPLWNSGTRRATQNQVAVDVSALAWQHSADRWKLAGEVREAASLLALALVERDGAARKSLEATQLAQDVERRVQAGELPRVDALQARASAHQAQGLLAQSDAALLRAQGQWRALTGQAQIASLDEAVAKPEALNTGAGAQTEPHQHPALQAAQAQVKSAWARLALAEADRRDPMSVGLSTTQERAAAGANPETSIRLALRIPLGGDNRNAPKLAAARAELDAAHAQADAIERQIEADAAAAQAQLEAARSQAVLAEQRATLSAQLQALVAKSYTLGESDLPTRMRADNEKLDAQLSLARARIELQRATSQLNQSLGYLP